MMYMFKERSDEWLTFRKSKISATEVASLLGLNSYVSANQLWHSKHSESVEKLDNAHLRDGRAAEALSFALLEESGWHLDKLAPRGHVMVFTEGFLSSTPDSFRWDGEPAVLEVKKVSKSKTDNDPHVHFKANWSGSCPPLRYMAQIQTQMHTTGLKIGYLTCVCLEDDIPLSIYKVVYSPEFFSLVDEAYVFYLAHPGGKKLVVKSALKTRATRLLEESYEFLGVHRYYKEIEISELFK